MNKELMQRMHELINFYVQDKEFMGTVMVAQDNDILLHQGYGFANIEWTVPNDTKTKFRLGSLTKQFTAAGILLLEERGLLKTDDYISQLLPNLPKAWGNIKLFHLLNHTHGIPNYTQLPEFRAITLFTKTPYEQIQLFIDKPLDFEPGTRYYYNNSGYVVLGFLIEQLTGLSYAHFIHEAVFAPLNMNNSGYDSFTEIIPYRASGYVKYPDAQVRNAEYLDMSLPYAAGSLYSTTADLLKWTQGLFHFKLLSDNSVKKMTTSFMEHYGFGVEVKEVDGIKVVMHTGGINGFHSALIYAPSTKTTIAVLSNLNTFGYVWDLGFIGQNIALKLLSVVHGIKVTLPSEKSAKKVALEILEQYVGEYDIKLNLKLTITLNNGQLKAAFSNQPVIRLYAETDTAFYSIVPDIRVQFLETKKGQVAQVYLSQGGYELIGTKINDR